MENSNKIRGWKTQEKKKRNLGLITSACGLPLPWEKGMAGSILFLLVMPRALRLPRFKADPQVISNIGHYAKQAGTAAVWGIERLHHQLPPLRKCTPLGEMTKCETH